MPGPIAGRVVGVIADAGSDLAGIAKLRKALAAQGAVRAWSSPRSAGRSSSGAPHARSSTGRSLTTRSIEFDAVVVAGGTAPAGRHQAHRAAAGGVPARKAIGAWGDGEQALLTADIDTTAPGILLGDTMVAAYTTELVRAIGLHRVWERTPQVMNGPGAA